MLYSNRNCGYADVVEIPFQHQRNSYCCAVFSVLFPVNDISLYLLRLDRSCFRQYHPIEPRTGIGSAGSNTGALRIGQKRTQSNSAQMDSAFHLCRNNVHRHRHVFTQCIKKFSQGAFPRCLLIDKHGLTCGFMPVEACKMGL